MFAKLNLQITHSDLALVHMFKSLLSSVALSFMIISFYPDISSRSFISDLLVNDTDRRSKISVTLYITSIADK